MVTHEYAVWKMSVTVNVRYSTSVTLISFGAGW